MRRQIKVIPADSFQSAPALCRAGDQVLIHRNAGAICFNPRPLFAERATRAPVGQSQDLAGFNPRPLFAERATRYLPLAAAATLVSIRARSLQSGRLRAVKLLLRKPKDGISREPE